MTVSKMAAVNSGKSITRMTGIIDTAPMQSRRSGRSLSNPPHILNLNTRAHIHVQIVGSVFSIRRGERGVGSLLANDVVNYQVRFLNY